MYVIVGTNCLPVKRTTSKVHRPFYVKDQGSA